MITLDISARFGLVTVTVDMDRAKAEAIVKDKKFPDGWRQWDEYEGVWIVLMHNEIPEMIGVTLFNDKIAKLTFEVELIKEGDDQLDGTLEIDYLTTDTILNIAKIVKSVLA